MPLMSTIAEDGDTFGSYPRRTVVVAPAWQFEAMSESNLIDITFGEYLETLKEV